MERAKILRMMLWSENGLRKHVLVVRQPHTDINFWDFVMKGHHNDPVYQHRKKHLISLWITRYGTIKWAFVLLESWKFILFTQVHCSSIDGGRQTLLSSPQAASRNMERAVPRMKKTMALHKTPILPKRWENSKTHQELRYFAFVFSFVHRTECLLDMSSVYVEKSQLYVCAKGKENTQDSCLVLWKH